VARVVRWLQIMGASARCGTCGAAMSGGQAAPGGRHPAAGAGGPGTGAAPGHAGPGWEHPHALRAPSRRFAPGDPSRGWPVRSGSAPDSEHQAALGMADRCRGSGRASTHPRHPTSDSTACASGRCRVVLSGQGPDSDPPAPLVVGTGSGLARPAGEAITPRSPAAVGQERCGRAARQGSPPGGGRQIDALITGLETPHRPDRGETDDGSRLRYTGALSA